MFSDINYNLEKKWSGGGGAPYRHFWAHSKRRTLVLVVQERRKKQQLYFPHIQERVPFIDLNMWFRTRFSCSFMCQSQMSACAGPSKGKIKVAHKFLESRKDGLALWSEGLSREAPFPDTRVRPKDILNSLASWEEKPGGLQSPRGKTRDPGTLGANSSLRLILNRNSEFQASVFLNELEIFVCVGHFHPKQWIYEISSWTAWIRFTSGRWKITSYSGKNEQNRHGFLFLAKLLLLSEPLTLSINVK